MPPLLHCVFFLRRPIHAAVCCLVFYLRQFYLPYAPRKLFRFPCLSDFSGILWIVSMVNWLEIDCTRARSRWSGGEFSRQPPRFGQVVDLWRGVVLGGIIGSQTHLKSGESHAKQVFSDI
ncbi:hypothetical protein L873DRAFT_1156515 [Choiromyces venosus 120613-1]|uniref:Uncharacterized protein n=1 Tax=Choiromyces venosus 120613-1 TaxID=1336337 RepID=A0A3N4JFM5_9PEZI|nr:hypothetical protein L873DRAFT_1156515 [Choiromyces venosus 120613-1]